MSMLNRVSARSAQESHLWEVALVWAAIWLATGVVLQGGGDFADMIPILTVGTAWFLAVSPALSARSRGRSVDD